MDVYEAFEDGTERKHSNIIAIEFAKTQIRLTKEDGERYMIPIKEVREIKTSKKQIKLTSEEYLINMLALKMGDDLEEDGIKKRNLNCFKAQQLIYLAMKQLKEKGIDLKIPYYWSTHGVRLELNQMVEMYPNINWTCREEEYNTCPYKIECDFTGKFGSGFKCVKQDQSQRYS